MTDLWHQFLTNPWLLAYAAGCFTGWQAARRSTAYMLGRR